MAFEKRDGLSFGFSKTSRAYKSGHFSKMGRGLHAAFENSNEIQKLDENSVSEFKT